MYTNANIVISGECFVKCAFKANNCLIIKSLLPDLLIIQKYHVIIKYIIFIEISMSFDRSSYVVDEDGGSISPVLELSEPAPCCITVYVELTDKTATG